MAENMPSSPTLHRAVYFRTLPCGPGGVGSSTGSAKQNPLQFSEAPNVWDAGASDWKDGHLSLSRSHLRSSRLQRWQKQIFPAAATLRMASTPVSMSETKMEQDLSGLTEEAEYKSVKIDLFAAVVNGGDLVSSMTLSNSMVLVQVRSQRDGFQPINCTCLVRGQKDAYSMCFSSDRQCILICYPVIGGLGIYLMSVQELRDEWESQVEDRRFNESKSCAGTPSLLELSRGRKLWQCCRGEGGKECSDENYVSDSLIEPTLLTVAEVLDNKGRPKLWERVNDGGGGRKPQQRVVWWQTTGGDHFAIIAGPSSGGRREVESRNPNCTCIHFVNLENFKSWGVKLLKDSSSVLALSVIELQIEDGDFQDEKGKTVSVMNPEEKRTKSEGTTPRAVSMKILVVTCTDPPAVYCLVLEYGEEEPVVDPRMGETQPSSMMNRHWLRSKENSVNEDGKNWTWWSGGNKRSSDDHLGDVLLLQPEEQLGGSLSSLSVIAPPSRYGKHVQLVGLARDGASIVYLQASALDIVSALTPTESNPLHDHFACIHLRTVSAYDMPTPAIASLKRPLGYVHGGDRYSSCFVSSKTEEEDMICVFENYSILTNPTQQLNSSPPLSLLLPDGGGPVCGIISTVSCGGIVDGNIVALVWSPTAMYYMRMGGKIGKDVKTGGHVQDESDLTRPGLMSPVKSQLSIITSPGKLNRRSEKIRRDWISILRSARAYWSQGECCHAVRQLSGAVRWAAKLPPFVLALAATKAVQFEMVDTLLSWLVDPELWEQDELLQRRKLDCFLKEEHVLEVEIVITRLLNAGLLHHAVSYACHRGSSAITALCNALSSEIGSGLALSRSDIVALCNSDPGASIALATSSCGYLLESLPVLAQVEACIGDRALLRSHPSLSWRLANLLSSLDTYCLASIAARLAQLWAYDAMDVGEPEMKRGYLTFLLEVLLETSRWGNFDDSEWWQLMTMGHEVSSGVLEFSTNSSLPIAVSVEDSTRGLLKAIQAEPLLALAGSGPNDEPQDSEGSTRTPTDSTKLASGAQRVLLAVLPLLRGYFDSCGLFLQSFDARNWPLCASILELENCPVEADTMKLCGVLALLQPRFPPCDFFSVLSGTLNASHMTTSSKMTTSEQKSEAGQTTLLPNEVNMEAACSTFMLKLLDNRSTEGMDDSVASALLPKICCLWQHLQFPVKELLNHLSTRINSSPVLCSALGKALYPQLDKQNVGNNRYISCGVEERRFDAVKTLPFNQTVRLKVLSHVLGGVGGGTTTPLTDDAALQSTSTSRILSECAQMEGPTSHSTPATMLLKPSHEQQHNRQDRPFRRANFEHTAADVVAFSCGHTMDRDQLIHTTLPVLPSLIDSCTKSLQITSELLVQEYTKPVLALSCPSCLIEALQKSSQLDPQSISNWMLG